MNFRLNQHLEVALLLCLESVEIGAELDLGALHADEPGLAAEVGEFVDTYREVERVAAPDAAQRELCDQPGPVRERRSALDIPGSSR
jgi:hypothetical protein